MAYSGPTDEMEAQGVVPLQVLHNALQLFLEDELVFLPYSGENI